MPEVGQPRFSAERVTGLGGVCRITVPVYPACAARVRRSVARRARDAHLDSLAGNEGPLWHQVGVLVGTRKPTDYDRAVVIVQDLRELAKREGTKADFGVRLRTLRAT